MSAEIPLSIQIGEVERELKLREALYPGWIGVKKIKAADAERQLRIMREVLATLQALRKELQDARRETSDA